MPSLLYDGHEGKRMYIFAEQIRGTGLSISSMKRTKSTPSLKIRTLKLMCQSPKGLANFSRI